MGLILQKSGLLGDLRLMPEDLQVAATQLKILLVTLLLESAVLILYQQQAIKNKEDSQQVIEDKKVIMCVLQPVGKVIPESVLRKITEHRQGEAENDIVHLLQEEDRQNPIQHKKELYPHVDVHGIDHSGHDRIQGKITDTG